MAYSTATEVRLVLQGLVETVPPGVGEFDVTPANLTDAQIAREIANADARIDLMVRRVGYSTPLPNPAPEIVHQLSIDIGSYFSGLTFLSLTPFANSLAPLYLRYQHALEILKLIAEGKYPIYDEDDDTAPERAGAIVINAYPSTVLKDADVFPRGIDFLNPYGRGEYSETEFIPDPPGGSGG